MARPEFIDHGRPSEVCITRHHEEAMVQPVNSYRLALHSSPAGGLPSLLWHTQEDAGAVAYDTEPARNDAQRAKVKMLSVLPLDNEL